MGANETAPVPEGTCDPCGHHGKQPPQGGEFVAAGQLRPKEIADPAADDPGNMRGAKIGRLAPRLRGFRAQGQAATQNLAVGAAGQGIDETDFPRPFVIGKAAGAEGDQILRLRR